MRFLQDMQTTFHNESDGTEGAATTSSKVTITTLKLKMSDSFSSGIYKQDGTPIDPWAHGLGEFLLMKHVEQLESWTRRFQETHDKLTDAIRQELHETGRNLARIIQLDLEEDTAYRIQYSPSVLETIHFNIDLDRAVLFRNGEAVLPSSMNLPPKILADLEALCLCFEQEAPRDWRQEPSDGWGLADKNSLDEFCKEGQVLAEHMEAALQGDYNI